MEKYEDRWKMEKFQMKTTAMKAAPNENSENAEHDSAGLG